MSERRHHHISTSSSAGAVAAAAAAQHATACKGLVTYYTQYLLSIEVVAYIVPCWTEVQGQGPFGLSDQSTYRYQALYVLQGSPPGRA